MIIGIDFDNTIVCWDRLFYQAALEKKLIPSDTPATKDQVRNYLRKMGKEDLWTELQGYAYGVLIKQAPMFSGIKEFLMLCKEKNIPVYIVSHKTRYPFLGQLHDLHQASYDWLDVHGFYDPKGIGLNRSHVFFELTKQEKLNRIVQVGCTHFVDDLPEFLLEQSFPNKTERILFDPNHQYLDHPHYRRVKSWNELKKQLIDERGLSADNQIHLLATSLLEQANLNGNFTLHQLKGGANNKIFRLDLGGSQFLLKLYFHHPEDSRDRLGAEYSFALFAWNNGLRTLPRPVAYDLENRAAIYEYVNGRKLTPNEISKEYIHQAVVFFKEINEHKQMPEAKKLSRASEACFSMSEHIQCVDKRVSLLANIEKSSPVDIEASKFVKNELLEVWSEVKEYVKNQSRNFEIDFDQQIKNKCISPSDFGFHNVLLTNENQLKFIDFEYAGWDDPVKLVCDFFCQPALPVDLKYFNDFATSVLEDTTNPEHELKRAGLLFSVYQVKWCCILLNHFVPTGSARRSFAQDNGSWEEEKLHQLAKARKMLQGLHLKKQGLRETKWRT